jgi:hypothetical protein
MLKFFSHAQKFKKSCLKINKLNMNFSTPMLRKYSTNPNEKKEENILQTNPVENEVKPVEEVIEPVIPEVIPETEEERKEREKREKRKKILRIIMAVVLSILGGIGYFLYQLFDKAIKYQIVADETEKSFFQNKEEFSNESPPIIDLVAKYLEEAFNFIKESKFEMNPEIEETIGDLKSIQLLNPNFCTIMTHSFYILPILKILQPNGKEKSKYLQTYSHTELNLYFPIINPNDNVVSVLDIKLRATNEPKEGELVQFELSSISLANPEVFMGSVDELFFEPLYGDSSQFSTFWNKEQTSFPILTVPEKQKIVVWHKYLEPMSQALPEPKIGHFELSTMPEKYFI